VRFSDEDLGAGVDVIVGNGFKRLIKAPRSLEVKRPQEYCVPVEPVPPLD
jgi:hypothetical protein